MDNSFDEWVDDGCDPEISITDKIAELAKLPLLEYEQNREKAAKSVGIRVSVLDKEVAKARPSEPLDEIDAAIIEIIEAWPDVVYGASLAEEIRQSLSDYVVFGVPSDADVATLWIFGSYLMDTWRLWPRIMITSPTKACGKSTLLEVIDAVAHRGLIIGNTKSAGVFRAIEAWQPTLLMDEADTWMKEDAELAGILNSGHTKRTARVIRVQEIDGELKPTLFSTWCPMVIAGIGTQRDTLTSRSVVISLRRKLANEQIKRLPIDLHERMTRVRRQATRWANDNAIRLGALTTEPPECGNDRRRDNFTPLWRIAEVLGGAWPERLAAAYAMSAATEDEDEPAGVMMLRDLMEMFERYPDARHLASSELVADLSVMEERPWSDWRHGRPITAQTISKLMKPFGVRPANAKITGRVLKAYHRKEIEAAFSRYAANPVNLPLPRYQSENKEENTDASRYPMTNGSGSDAEFTKQNQSGSGVAGKMQGSEDKDITDTLQGKEAWQGLQDPDDPENPDVWK